MRSLFDRDFIAFLGSEREELVFRAVGMFRLNYSSQRPSPLVAAVYEKVKNEPLFQQAWNRRIVVSDLDTQNVMVRNHALLGRLAVSAIDLSVAIAARSYFAHARSERRRNGNEIQPLGGHRKRTAGTRLIAGQCGLAPEGSARLTSTYQVDLSTWLQRFRPQTMLENAMLKVL